MTPSLPTRKSLSAHDLTGLLGEWRGAGSAYRQLADRLQLLVTDGRIRPDTWLPPERELAQELRVSRTTIISAYRELRDSGFGVSVRGSGTRAVLPAAGSVPVAVYDTEVVDLTRAAFSMWSGLPAAFRGAAENLTSDQAGLGYDLRGSQELRDAVAHHFTQAGLGTTASQILITIGAQHGMSLVFDALLERGDSVIVESPTYPHAIDAIRAAGGRTLPVPVTDGSWDVDELRRTAARDRPAMAYLMPDHHNPSGSSMDAATRTAVVDATLSAGTMLVIDETTRHLTVEMNAELPPPLATLVPEGRKAITLGSLGKTTWGGLRLGWIRAEESTIQQLVAYRSSRDMGTPTFDQAVGVIALSHYEEVLAERAAQLRSSRDFLCSELDARFPRWRYKRPPGGMSLWVDLGIPVSTHLSLAARACGLSIAAGPRFATDGSFERFIRIPFSGDTETILRGMQRLSVAWKSVTPEDGITFEAALETVV